MPFGQHHHKMLYICIYKLVKSYEPLSDSALYFVRSLFVSPCDVSSCDVLYHFAGTFFPLSSLGQYCLLPFQRLFTFHYTRKVPHPLLPLTMQSRSFVPQSFPDFFVVTCTLCIPIESIDPLCARDSYSFNVSIWRSYSFRLEYCRFILSPWRSWSLINQLFRVNTSAKLSYMRVLYSISF